MSQNETNRLSPSPARGGGPGWGQQKNMNTTPETRLLELYDCVAEAPDAIEPLRKFVLNLAVRGKLVEQDPADEAAEELLKRTAAENPMWSKRGSCHRVPA